MDVLRLIQAFDKRIRMAMITTKENGERALGYV